MTNKDHNIKVGDEFFIYPRHGDPRPAKVEKVYKTGHVTLDCDPNQRWAVDYNGQSLHETGDSFRRRYAKLATPEVRKQVADAKAQKDLELRAQVAIVATSKIRDSWLIASEVELLEAFVKAYTDRKAAESAKWEAEQAERKAREEGEAK